MCFLPATRAQRGFSTLELLAVVAIVVLSALLALPALTSFFRSHETDAATSLIRASVQVARIKALKEKTSYRVVLHDENATAPNRIELQRNQGGTFVAVPGETYSTASTVSILGSGSTNSVDTVTVSGRGECTTGNVYVQGTEQPVAVVSVAATCFTNIP